MKAKKTIEQCNSNTINLVSQPQIQHARAPGRVLTVSVVVGYAALPTSRSPFDARLHKSINGCFKSVRDAFSYPPVNCPSMLDLALKFHCLSLHRLG